MPDIKDTEENYLILNGKKFPISKETIAAALHPVGTMRCQQSAQPEPRTE